MSKFKVGDRVKCVVGSGRLLPEGSVHTVLWAGKSHQDNDDMVGLANREPEWCAYRFELVEPVPKAPRTQEQVRDDRRKELLDAIVSHHTAGLEIPQAWIGELAYGRG